MNFGVFSFFLLYNDYDRFDIYYNNINKRVGDEICYWEQY